MLRSLLRRGRGTKAVRLPCQRTAFRLRHGGASDGRRSQLARGAGGGGSPAGASDDRLLDELCGAGNPVGRRSAGVGTLWRGGKFHALRRRSGPRSEEHTSELQSLMRISYAVFCLKKKKHRTNKY